MAKYFLRNASEASYVYLIYEIEFHSFQFQV